MDAIDAQINIRRAELNAQAKEDKRNRDDATALVISYAQDVVDFWPNMSMRTIRIMIPKMLALKEALDLIK